MRVLLVLLHDFPEFLCDYHFALCDVIPPSCIQMRNLVLSAFPHGMRLPDPFTPNLKVDLLPEIQTAPRCLSDYVFALGTAVPPTALSAASSSNGGPPLVNLQPVLDNYLKKRAPASFPMELLGESLLSVCVSH